jgi:hypothetical protein
MIAVRSWFEGAGAVLRAPLVLAGVLLITMLAAVPFGAVMSTRLQSALANQPPVTLGSEEIDADWWLEFRRHAEGLEATFTPTVIGFAAPLDNLSALLDGTPRPWALALPVVIAIVVWAFLWGALIQRFRDGGQRGTRAFLAAGTRWLLPFMAISAAAALAQALLYVTLHALLFGPVFTALAALTESERNAFFIRVLLYGVFGVGLAAISLVADYSRIGLATAAAPSLGSAVSAAQAFVRRRWTSVTALFLLTALPLGVLFVIYGVGEAYGGSRVAGWRGVAIGQAFILVRLAFRLTFIASETRLYERSEK